MLTKYEQTFYTNPKMFLMLTKYKVMDITSRNSNRMRRWPTQCLSPQRQLHNQPPRNLEWGIPPFWTTHRWGKHIQSMQGKSTWKGWRLLTVNFNIHTTNNSTIMACCTYEFCYIGFAFLWKFSWLLYMSFCHIILPVHRVRFITTVGGSNRNLETKYKQTEYQ